MAKIEELQTERRRRDLIAERDRREVLPKPIPEDTWDYVLDEDGSLADVLPFVERVQYDKLLENARNPDDFEKALTSSLYMADLMGMSPSIFYDGPEAYSREIFGEELGPSQVVAHATKDNENITRYLNAWNSLQKSIAESKEVPSWWEDVVSNRFVSSIARIGSGGATLISELSTRPLGSPFGPTHEVTQADREFAEVMKDNARLLWRVSTDPETAMRRDDWLNGLVAMAVETGPYITATTGASLALGPAGAFGGFVVGAAVEGNSSYQTALDELPKLRPDLSEEEREKLASSIGLGVGIISGAIESFGGRIADDVMQKATQKIVNRWARRGVQLGLGSLIEGGEELGQEIAAITGETFYKELDWDEAIRRSLTAAGGGVALGGIFKFGSATLRGVTAESPRLVQIRALRMAAAEGTLTKEVVDSFEDRVTEITEEQEAAKEAAKAPEKPVEAVTPAEPTVTPEVAAVGIRSAAFQLSDGSVVEGTSHPTIVLQSKDAGIEIPDTAIAGFVTSEGNFVTREQAADIVGQKTPLEARELGPFGRGPEQIQAQPPAPAEAKKPKEPTTLGPDVTGILGGLPQEPTGLTKDEIQHLGKQEQTALRAAQKRGLKVGFKQGAAATVLDARRTIAALITKTKINDKNKMDLASIVLTYVPKDQQGRFIRRILDLKTPKAARKLTAKIKEAVETLVERQAVRDAKTELKKQIKRIPKFGRKIKLRPATIEKIEAALEDVDVVKLSKAKRAELEGIRDELKEVGFKVEEQFSVPKEEELSGIEAVVGERVVKQLQRLQKESIADMSAEEVLSIADAIRYALDQDSKETKERRKTKSEKVAKQNTEAVGNITPTAKSQTIDAGERGIKITIPKIVYNFVREDSLHRWALIESATSEGLNTTAQVLDQDIHEGKNKKIDKEFEALEPLWDELERIKWTQTDFERRSEEHSVKLGGKTYKLTIDEIISLGMNVRSDRNAKEIVRTEYLEIADLKVKTPTIGEIVDAMYVLTDKELAMMDFIPTLNENVLMPAINKVSEDFLGFSLATDPFYWGLRRVVERDVRGRTTRAANAIEDRGPFQEFVGSTLPLRIVPFWDQLLAQIQNTASFHGLALPMENARTMLNSRSWRDAMDEAGRTKEKENLITLYERMQGTITDRDSLDVLGSVFLGRSAKAILGWRLSTMAIQTASLPMAYTIIPDKYTLPLAGLTVQKGSAQSNRIDEFSAMLKLRHVAGRTNIVTGDASVASAVDNLIFRQPTDKSMEGMRRSDRVVMEAIDTAVQRWVADTMKLKVGGKKYWREVAHREEDVVRKTQPMWDVDERSIHGSTPGAIKRSFFIFRSAREAVLNQNIIAIDRLVKADDKGAATKHLANVLAATTISTAMVVAIRTVMFKALGALFAALTGRKRPDEDDEPKDVAVDFVTDMLKTTVEYAPLGRVITGVVKLATRRRLYDELDPDSILLGIPVATGKTLGHLTSAYDAYFNDGDMEKLKKELIGALTDAADAYGRVKGLPVGGILQLTTQPLERALREPEEPVSSSEPI